MNDDDDDDDTDDLDEPTMNEWALLKCLRVWASVNVAVECAALQKLGSWALHAARQPVTNSISAECSSGALQIYRRGENSNHLSSRETDARLNSNSLDVFCFSAGSVNCISNNGNCSAWIAVKWVNAKKSWKKCISNLCVCETITGAKLTTRRRLTLKCSTRPSRIHPCVV